MRIQQIPTPVPGGPSNGGSVSLQPILGRGPAGPTGSPGPTGATGAPGGSDGSFAGWINDPASATATALHASLVPKWQPSTAYTAGQIVMAPDGSLVERTSNGTSGATYSGTNWKTAGGLATQINARTDSLRRARFSALPNQPVVTSCGVMQTTNSSSSATGYTSREAYKTAVACTDLQLVYPLGWYLNNSAELALAQANTIKAAIEYPSGTITPVFLNGQRSVTVDPWGTVKFDPVAIEIPANTEFWVRTYIDSTTGEAYPGGFPGGGPGIATTSVGYTTGDSVDSGTTWTNDWINGFWNPIVCGLSTQAPTAIYAAVGDSISVGTGDPNSRPWWKYGLQSAPLPAISYARTGCRADKIAATHKRGFPLLQGATHATVLLGVNDFGNSRTLAQVKADLTTIYTALRVRGMKVIGCTLLPWTTSTDSWATTGNQTPSTGFGPTGNRADLNAWIRAGADGLIDGFLELADSVETGRDTGIWKAAYTSDGIHPATVGHQAMGAVLTAAVTAGVYNLPT